MHKGMCKGAHFFSIRDGDQHLPMQRTMLRGWAGSFRTSLRYCLLILPKDHPMLTQGLWQVILFRFWRSFFNQQLQEGVSLLAFQLILCLLDLNI